jgi:hypothetical protein
VACNEEKPVCCGVEGKEHDDVLVDFGVELWRKKHRGVDDVLNV